MNPRKCRIATDQNESPSSGSSKAAKQRDGATDFIDVCSGDNWLAVILAGRRVIGCYCVILDSPDRFIPLRPKASRCERGLSGWRQHEKPFQQRPPVNLALRSPSTVLIQPKASCDDQRGG
jgi:hypothetical protein